ncbi:uncharacterized protein LOC123305792 [Chrysoperla carnea]|uniref:uncharacterized protein LOC123305792 n=1 Tax=Chrysoperla carnea TaxID=189513 RepID=UPI001D084636|nr:uncharacterized protein LOC123305792 [Chrysoperla carnea]
MKFILLSVLISTITICNGRVLPDSITGCKRSDPNLNQCSTVLLNKLRPEIEKGIPSIKLPPIDPFKLNVVNIDKALEGIKITGKFTDIVAAGGSKFIVEEVNLNPKTLDGKVKIKIPELKLSGGYDLNGKLLQIPLNIKGKMTGNFNGIDAVVDLKSNEIDDKGVKRLKLTQITSKIKVGGGKLNLVESNAKNQQAADIAMNFFNENSAEVLQSVAPIIDETASQIIKSILSEMLEVIPSEELFPN